MLTSGGVEVFTIDGRAATIRRVRPDDKAALEDLFDRASPESRRLRFFSPSTHAAHAYVAHVMSSDPSQVVALVLERGTTIVGFATAEVLDATTAEISFMVADAEHGQGIGTLLVEHLAAAARNLGIVRFTADVLHENIKMNKVFRDAGFEIKQHTESGVVEVTMSTSATAAAIEAADARECAAEATSLRPLLYPRSIALVGVRHESGGIGRAVLREVESGEFTGEIFVIHPTARSIDHQNVYPSFAALPHPVDLAVVAVPAAQVLDVVTEAADAGARSAVVLSAGFGEMGPEGARAQRALAEAARLRSIRVVGPNCLGVIANHPDIKLNATFTDILPPPGGLAVASQSGGVGIAMVDLARRTGLGILAFVSLGNKADVSGNDMLAAWMDDPNVTGAALYLESFGNTIKFARLARRFSERKPLLAVAGGRSEGGRRAGVSHTAAAAAPSVAVDALFAQSGVIGCRGVSEMIHAARLLAEQPLPRGSRLGILGNAGGLGVLAADSAARHALEVPALSEATQAGVRGLVSETLGVGNPVDLGAGATDHSLDACVDTLLGSGEIDSLLVIAARTGVAGSRDLLRGLSAVRARHPELPVLVVGLGFDEFDRTGLTVFDDAETATDSLARAVAYAAWRSTPAGELPAIDVSRARRVRMEAQQILEGPTSPSGWLAVPQCQELLAHYDIEGPLGAVSADLDGAAGHGRRLRVPRRGEGRGPERPAQDRPGAGASRRGGPVVAAAGDRLDPGRDGLALPDPRATPGGGRGRGRAGHRAGRPLRSAGDGRSRGDRDRCVG